MYEWHTWWTCQVRGVSRYSKGFWIALPRVCNQRDEQDGLLKSLFSWGKRNRNLGPLRDYETFFFKWRRFRHLRILVILGVVLSLTYYYSISEHILSISYRNYIHYMNVRNSVSLSLSLALMIVYFRLKVWIYDVFCGASSNRIYPVSTLDPFTLWQHDQDTTDNYKHPNLLTNATFWSKHWFLTTGSCALAICRAFFSAKNFACIWCIWTRLTWPLPSSTLFKAKRFNTWL